MDVAKWQVHAGEVNPRRMDWEVDSFFLEIKTEYLGETKGFIQLMGNQPPWKSFTTKLEVRSRDLNLCYIGRLHSYHHVGCWAEFITPTFYNVYTYGIRKERQHQF